MKITNDVIYIGVDDKDIDLFESQYIVENGIAYNSYLILDEKIAVMDTVDKRKTDEWYKNLEDIRYVAKAKKLPIWAFALSLSVGDEAERCPIPTTAELRLQQFSNLAYGAQGFQYWTFHGIYRNSKSQIYDRVLQVNKELQALSKIFLGAEVTDVWHTGAELPYGTKALEKMPDGIKSLVTSDKGAVVSRVIKGSNTYIAIVNKDYQADMTLDIEFTGKAMKFDSMGYKAEAQSGRTTLSPGNIIVYQIN